VKALGRPLEEAPAPHVQVVVNTLQAAAMENESTEPRMIEGHIFSCSKAHADGMPDLILKDQVNWPKNFSPHLHDLRSLSCGGRFRAVTEETVQSGILITLPPKVPGRTCILHSGPELPVGVTSRFVRSRGTNLRVALLSNGTLSRTGECLCTCKMSASNDISWLSSLGCHPRHSLVLR
jgi:hypothetical protein